MALPGRYYAPRSAAYEEASLELGQDGSVAVHADGRKNEFGADEVEVSRALGRLPRRFAFANGASFECEDDPSVDAWLATLGRHRFNLGLRRLEDRWRWAAVALVVLVALVAAFARFGIPSTARLVARLIPDATRIGIGDQTERMIDPLLGEAFDGTGPVYEELRAYFGRLAARADVGLVLNLEFRDGGRLGENAFALPNGNVVVTRQLVELTGSSLGVAGVIAHEIGHIHYRHGLQRALQASMFPALLTLITGDLATSTTLLGALVTNLVENGYSRAQEREADRFAAEIMAGEGLSTEPLADLLEALLEAHGDLPEVLSTHPATWDRVAFFRGEASP